MTLDAVEFIRRFLLHVLPSGLVRIRQFGFLANRVRKQKLERCRALLGARTLSPITASEDRPHAQIEDAHRCPICKLGRLIVIELGRQRMKRKQRSMRPAERIPIGWALRLVRSGGRLLFAFASISSQDKERFNPHRFVPAQFNEFYPKCSDTIFAALSGILPSEHSG